MTSFIPRPESATAGGWTAPSPARALAVGAGLLLVGSYVSVFYHVADVVGSARAVAAAVVGAVLLGTAFAAVGSVRAGLLVAGALLAAGSGAYLLLVPSLHDSVVSPGFVVDNLRYLTGISVLKFRRADLWAVGVVPGPVFLSWYLTLERRYDLAALVGGATLGLFALTGDAGPGVTLAGSTGLLAMLGFGGLEDVGDVRDQLEQVGLVVLVAVVAARVLDLAPGHKTGTNIGGDDSGTGGGTAGGASGARTSETALEGNLLDAESEMEILGSISLSPTVRFTVRADAPAYWRVAAYDRYTGTGWVRSGNARPYEGTLDPPPGSSTPLEQTVQAATDLGTMPAAWKPVRVDSAAADTRVTDLGGLQPRGTLAAGDAYTVVSRVPDWTPETLRAAGTDYPAAVRERFLQLPGSTPSRLGRKARELTRDDATPYGAALRVEQWIKETKSYSLSVTRPAGDVADAFVFEMDRGYCVYTATAMVVLLRTLDIPARVATGYTTGERVAEGRWVVRGLDAHAWVEVYFPGVGWVPFDPTPAAPRRRAERDRLAAARANGTSGVDTAETGPNARTPTEQEFGSRVGTPTATPDPPVAGSSNASASVEPTTTTAASGSPAERGGPVLPTLSERDRLTAAAALAALFVGAHHAGLAERAYRALWLRWQPRTGSPRADVEGAFDRAEYLLGRRYRERRPAETPRQYLAALEGEYGLDDARVRRLVALHERARYAAVSDGEADEAVALAAALVDD